MTHALFYLHTSAVPARLRLWPNEKNETQFITRISQEARVNSGSGTRVCRHKWKREGLSTEKRSGEPGPLLAH